MSSRPNAYGIDWNIGLKGRGWDGESGEARARHDLTNEMKLEMSRGKLMFYDNDRLILAGLLIENLGAEAIVKLGDPAVWKAAVAQLD
jgi:hypothetical protein